MLLLVFALETLCTFFSCAPTHGDPKPGPGVSQTLGGLSGRRLFDRAANDLELPSSDKEYRDYDLPPVVQTLYGALKGHRMKTIKGRDISAFTSIPYAEPPVGNLRFRPPVRKRPWQGVRDALTLLPYCVQLDGVELYRLKGTEDCLYMNVFTPKLYFEGKFEKLLPVLIYIHGGAFVFGNGNYGPAYLLDQDVILVTLNYRVGPLGFLSTGDEAAPGNFGLKDQALAMEWVADNIEYFGGNKSQVTLMGQSAGAVSVHLHMMSQRTQGLFHRAIAHSASAFVFWAIRERTPSLTVQLAQSFRCPLNDSYLLVDCLRRQDSSFLVSEQFNLWHWWVLPGVLFGPVVEHPSEDAILTALPTDLYKAGNVSRIPFMSGVVRDEGEVFGVVFSHVAGMRGVLNRRWSSLAPHIFDYVNAVNATQGLLISREIQDFYLGHRRFTFNTKELVHNAFGDRYMVTGVHKGLQYHTAYGSPTYGYYFDYRGRSGLARSLGYRQSEWGVTHGDDLLYFMNNSNWFHPLELNTPDYSISEFLINLWTNFVSKGSPLYTDSTGADVEIWPRITDPANMRFLHLNEKPEVILEPFRDRIKFWEALNVTFFPEP